MVHVSEMKANINSDPLFGFHHSIDTRNLTGNSSSYQSSTLGYWIMNLAAYLHIAKYIGVPKWWNQQDMRDIKIPLKLEKIQVVDQEQHVQFEQTTRDRLLPGIVNPVDKMTIELLGMIKFAKVEAHFLFFSEGKWQP